VPAKANMLKLANYRLVLTNPFLLNFLLLYGCILQLKLENLHLNMPQMSRFVLCSPLHTWFTIREKCAGTFKIVYFIFKKQHRESKINEKTNIIFSISPYIILKLNFQHYEILVYNFVLTTSLLHLCKCAYQRWFKWNLFS